MKTVLIVDDNKAAADALVRLFTALGYEARARYSGVELLDSLTTEVVDIAFVDIGMPGMDGYETARTARTNGCTIPLVALSGYGQSEDKEQAAAAGFTCHLTKPVGVQDIRATLEELL